MEDKVIHLDYTLETKEERTALVKQIVDNADPKRLTPNYLQILADYILTTPDAKKDKDIITPNRLKTIQKRETSYQGLADKFENGEDGLYALFIKDKGARLTPQIEITEDDIQNVPGLRDIINEIKRLEELEKTATGKNRFNLKKDIIALRQQQYELKNAYYQPVQFKTMHGSAVFDFNENITMDEEGEPHSDGLLTLFNPEHISQMLCHYQEIKTECYGQFNNGMFYLMADLDDLIENFLKVEYPIYYTILKCKTNGDPNTEIQETLQKEHGVYHSIEYISALWRNKIPKVLSEKAKENYILWYYTEVEKGTWKKCNRCGKVKLAHNRFFSHNNTSKDGWYSICKECRNEHKKIEVGRK